jgi:hypothetical protein
LKYRAILCKNEEESLNTNEALVVGDVELRHDSSTYSQIPEQKLLYSFSEDINVTFMILPDRLSITGKIGIIKLF